MKPISLINRFLFEGKDLDIAEISTINEDCRPLLLHQKYPEPLTVDCSEAASLIPLPGGDGMTIAHKVYHLAEPGDSGSWIVDGKTGNLLGILVSASAQDDYSYMLPPEAVFNSISHPSNHRLFGSPNVTLPSRGHLSSAHTAMRLLKQALKDQQWAIVKLLLQKMDLTAIKVEDNIPQDAPIVIASSYGNESTVQALLEAGAAASQYALETACRGGHDKVVKMLLEAGASPEGPNLTDASKAGHERVVQLLLQADADAAVESLELACRGGHDKVVKILLEAGAKPSHSCLLDSSGAGHERVVELLLQADADALRQSLELACQRGHDGVVKILLDAGAELPNFGLFEASRAGHERVVQLLLPKASAVPSRYVKYAFCQAVENGLEGIVALFLQADVGIDAWAVEALCIAFRRVHLKVAKLLIDSGVDVREARRQLVADGSVGGPEHIEHLLVAAGCHMSWEGDEDLEPFARVGAAMEKDPPMEGDEYRGRFVLGVGAAMEEGSVVLGTMPPTFLSLTPSRPGSHIPVSATMGGGNLLAQSYSEMARREFVPSGANPLSFSDYDSDPDSRRRGRKARVIAQTGPQKAH